MAPAMAPRARPHRTLTLAERKKKALTRVNTGAPGGIRTPNLLIRSQMLYPLSHGCGRLMRPLAAEQHRESVSAQTAPTNREQRAQASASWAARTPLFRLTSLSNPGAATLSPTR